MFKKSSRSNAGGACVDVDLEAGPDLVRVRHSTRPDGTTIGYSRKEWTAFTEGVKLGEFDLV